MAFGLPDPFKPDPFNPFPQPSLEDMVKYIYNFAQSVWSMIQSIYLNMLWLVAQLKKIPNGIFSFITKIVHFFKDVPGHIVSYITGLFSWLSGCILGLVSWFGSSFSWLVSQIPAPFIIAAPIIIVLVLGLGYFLVRIAFWVYHQVPIFG